jgi:hypothetical protein
MQVVHVPTTSAAEEFAAGSEDNLLVHSITVTTSKHVNILKAEVKTYTVYSTTVKFLFWLALFYFGRQSTIVFI